MAIQIDQQVSGNKHRIIIRGELNSGAAGELFSSIGAVMGGGETRSIEVDLEGVVQIDSAGAVVLMELVNEARKSGRQIRFTGIDGGKRGLLELADPGILLEPAAAYRRKPDRILVKLGEGALTVWRDMKAFLTFIGDFSVELARSCAHPGRVRWGEVLFYMERTGVDAVPIIVLMALLLGLILGFQAAIQLRQFGANIFVADLVGVAITRELGPLIAAIIVAGRSGSAFAAEIGTMKVSEEVAAMEVMGFDRMRFLVIPKIAALIIMLPCLALMADGIGVLGGMVVGVFQLDLSVTHYIEQTRQALVLADIFTGLLKSSVFALLIAGIGCFRGFQVTTDAESVGRMTTSAVVSGIFLIVATDAAFSVVFYALGV